MTVVEAITPNTAILKAWQNWALVALVLFLTGVVVHLVASQVASNKSEN